MLTEVKAYSSWQDAPELLLSDTGRAETDLVQVRNIDGLDPVKASVNTSPLGSVDGDSYIGSNVSTRNIVLTVGSNPNWDEWSYEALRRVLYEYFMPKRLVKLVFESDDLDPVEISGYVESAEDNMFSKDPELVASIICPDPYFTAVDPKTIYGTSVRPGDPGDLAPIVTYNGNIETGVHLQVTQNSGAIPTFIGMQQGKDPMQSYFQVTTMVNPTNYFELNSVPKQKFVQNVDMSTGVITSLLSKVVKEGSDWPIFVPGKNEFFIYTDQGIQDWELSYYERFGGL